MYHIQFNKVHKEKETGFWNKPDKRNKLSFANNGSIAERVNDWVRGMSEGVYTSGFKL